MSECSTVRERFSDLLVERLSEAERELTHRHVEACASCKPEWDGMRDAWRRLGTLEDVPVPARARDAFLAQVRAMQKPEERTATVVAFRQRPAARWLAQAAAVAVLVGGSFIAGRQLNPGVPRPSAQSAEARGVIPLRFSLAEEKTITSAQLSPEIEGSPRISNVQFSTASDPNQEVTIAFDLTSHVTVNGRPDDASLVRLMSHLLQNQDHPTIARSRTLEWVRATYATTGVSDPEIVKALANVLRNDDHEGVRIKAVETLEAVPPAAAAEARSALIDALQNDPNPAVRIKAVDALARLARNGDSVDAASVETLRRKAVQGDENPYVRVKAAEALGRIDL